MGRLGSLFGYELYGVEPDVMTLAKGLGGGLPIGAFLTKQWCDVLRPGDHGSTFGGNPVTCAAAYAVTRVIVQERLWEKGRIMGGRLMDGLCKLQDRYKSTIKSVRGKGLLQAVEFDDDIASAVVSACNDQGLLLNPVRPNAVRFMPPLTVTAKEVDQGLTLFEQGLKRTITDKKRD
jgi:acetylornithine/N-succinyldiaminopimelate aminotransferase